MAANINVVGICARKGDIPTGTGLPDSAFCQSNRMPLDVSGNAIPGYTLQSDNTSLNGTNWQYTGANGKTIRLYQFPDCPIPFPTPSEVSSDLVQITRIEGIVPEAGLIDIAMPVLGIQGFVPTHSLPPLCDVSKQIVFFFDDANAAVNVYQIVKKQWRMGYIRAIPGANVRWRAAALLTSDKIKTSSPTYTAPYNAEGLFFSISSTRLTNQIQQSVDFTEDATGFYFVNYAVNNDNFIQPWPTASMIQPFETQGDISVSAIATVDQKKDEFRAPTAGSANEVVAAIAVSTESVVTGRLYGWWGFLGITKVSPTKSIFNPDLSTGNFLDFCFRSGNNPNYTPTGFMQTISYDGNTIFFLGGNYSYIRFSNAVVERLVTGGANQIAAVAMQYTFTSAAMTSANYVYVGPTPSNDSIWFGRIAQSNYVDGYFAYGGTFGTPQSSVISSNITPYNVQTDYFIPQNFNLYSSLPSPVYATGLIPEKSRGGVIGVARFLFDGNSPDLSLNSPTVESLGVCLNIVPDRGDVSQGSFAKRFIGGNFLNPADYNDDNIHFFQTQQPIKPSDWWISTISFYVTDPPTSAILLTFILLPNPSSVATAPYSWTLSVTLSEGLNTVPFLGGDPDDLLFNTHIKASSSPVSINTLQTYFLIIFSNDNTFFKVGVNSGNGNAYAGCWNLEGYPADPVAGRFSATSIANGAAEYNNTSNTNGGFTLEYQDLNYQTPLAVTSYFVYVIPINMKDNNPLIAGVDEDGDGICAFVVSEDRQGTFNYSCLHNPSIPAVVYEIPGMNTTTGEQPAFSLFMNSRYEIYKTAFANGDNLGLGLYTNFQEVTDVFSTRTNKAAANLLPGECAIAVTAPETLSINPKPNAFILPPWPEYVSTNDIVKIARTDNGEFNQYRITGITLVGTVIRTYNLTRLTGTTPFQAAGNQVKITFVLSRNPLQTPFVLKTDLGQYVLGNGSAPTTLRDLFLAPSQNNGKAYRYIPDYENNFLSFRGKLLLNSPTTDDLYEFNTAMFNSNGSSVLLTAVGNNWVISAVSGNVGFNTQNA